MNPIISAFIKGIEKAGVKASQISIVSDIPFEPEVVKELGVDFFHTIRGRAIAFGTGLKLANPKLKVVPFVGDLMTIGGNHFVHSARRNMEMLVVCINNFAYKKIADQLAPKVADTFSAYSTYEAPFNIPHLANSCGAVYTARWTALHTEDITTSVSEAINKRGFAVIEILCPGPSYYTEIGKIEQTLLNFYYKHSVIKNGEEPRNVGIDDTEKIIVGKFTDKERTTFIDSYNTQLGKALGDKFTPYGA